METAIVPLNDTLQLGKVLAESGFFADSRSASQAVVKVLAGREIGFGPVASMTGINIIQGRVSLSANIMAAAVKRSGRYNFRVREMTEAVCKIEFFERNGDKWESIGVSAFTDTDARKAGTKNMDKYPRNMLYARAMSNGVRWYCPDVTGGPVYTPEELGAQVDGDGDVIDTTARVVSNTPAQAGNGHDEAFDDMPSASTTTRCTDAQRKAMFAIWTKLYGRENLPGLKGYIQEHYGTEHTTELTVAQASAIIEALKATEQAQGGAA
jgi:hypothetical protein